MFENKLKKFLKDGQTVFGTFVTCDSPDFVEIIGLSGFDFAIIDTEHGPLSIESSINLIRSCELRNITPIIRVTEGSESTILRSLDIGAHGIQVPQVNHLLRAKEIVNASKYYPIGTRGLALARSADYGAVTPLDYFKNANDQTMIVLHCENKESLDHLEEIVKIPEIDVIFLGPFDMSQSLGIPGQINHPIIQEVASNILKLTKEYGKAAGIFVPDGEQAKLKASQGFQYITIGLDISLFANGCKHELRRAKL